MRPQDTLGSGSTSPTSHWELLHGALSASGAASVTRTAAASSTAPPSPPLRGVEGATWIICVLRSGVELAADRGHKKALMECGLKLCALSGIGDESETKSSSETLPPIPTGHSCRLCSYLLPRSRPQSPPLSRSSFHGAAGAVPLAPLLSRSRPLASAPWIELVPGRIREEVGSKGRRRWSWPGACPSGERQREEGRDRADKDPLCGGNGRAGTGRTELLCGAELLRRHGSSDIFIVPQRTPQTDKEDWDGMEEKACVLSHEDGEDAKTASSSRTCRSVVCWVTEADVSCQWRRFKRSAPSQPPGVASVDAVTIPIVLCYIDTS
nr:uncharacterized protein LOC127325517 [Lolium perenne]